MDMHPRTKQRLLKRILDGGLADLLAWVRRAERARVRHLYEEQFRRLQEACARRDRRLRNAKKTIANYDAEIQRLSSLLEQLGRSPG
jgi:hypothetical protein